MAQLKTYTFAKGIFAELLKYEYIGKYGFDVEKLQDKITYRTNIIEKNKDISCFFNIYYCDPDSIEVLVKIYSPMTCETATFLCQNIVNISEHELFVIVEEKNVAFLGTFDIDDISVYAEIMHKIINSVLNTTIYTIKGAL